MTRPRYGILLAQIALATLLLCAIPLVSADEMNPTITHVFFEKDGAPYNASVHYTVNCYGHRSYFWNPQAAAEQQNTSSPPEVVFSYTATCPEYGCVVYEPYYLNYRVIDSCDLEGETAKGSFKLKNFSASPLPVDCTDLHQIDMMKGPSTQNPAYDRCINASEPTFESCTRFMGECRTGVDKDCVESGGRMVADTPASRACYREAVNATHACDDLRNPDEYYKTTPAYDQCMNASYAASELCNQYVVPCSPTADKGCGNWIIDGRYVKDTPRSIFCRNDVDKKQRACDMYLARVDLSTIIMWKDPWTGRDEGPVMRNCIARFVIPSDNETGQVFVPPMQAAHMEMENIPRVAWCRILEFLGGGCE